MIIWEKFDYKISKKVLLRHF